eukprot:scaffold5358_cov68-Phaeocystis_antarctica.AAC.1
MACSHRVLTERSHTACTPTACSHTAYAHLSAPPRLASLSLPHTPFFLRPRLDTASRPDASRAFPSRVPRHQEGRWARSTAGSEVSNQTNYL